MASVCKSFRRRWGKLLALLPQKRRKDAVLTVEYVMTPSWCRSPKKNASAPKARNAPDRGLSRWN